MIGAAFSALPLSWRITAIAGLATVVLGGAAGAYAYVDHQGYHRADLEWQVKWAQMQAQLELQRSLERARQQAANDAAKAEEAAELEAERKRLLAAADLAMTLATEAAADPNHDNIALDADAVDRHNRRID